jgi:2-polyprenyl-3-methyl-5-hydroxy-6-metoxy-1,4-benzoquinol methylase
MELGPLIDETKVRRPNVHKRDFLTELVRGKSVLDIGCIDHSAVQARALGDRWLHKVLRHSAGEIVGLDVLEEAADELAADGYKIEIGDAQDFDLGRTFDVIVAGDIIEHLTNVGGFLESVKRHMTPNSQFAVTTPNPFNIEQTIRVLRDGWVAANSEHVSWIDPRVMWQLTRRHGLEVEQFRWIETDYPLLGNRAALAVAEAVMRLRPSVRRDFAVVLRLAS